MAMRGYCRRGFELRKNFCEGVDEFSGRDDVFGRDDADAVGKRRADEIGVEQ